MRKQRLKRYGLMGICVIIVAVILWKNITGEQEKEKNQIEDTLQNGITRAEAYRMFSFLLFDRTERKKLAEKGLFTDIEEENGYYEYFAAVQTAGLLPENSKKVRPNDFLTCGEFRDSLISLCKEADFSYSEVTKSLPERLKTVTEDDILFLSEFLELYQLLYEKVNEKAKNTFQIRMDYILAEEAMKTDVAEDAEIRGKNANEEAIIYTSNGEKLQMKAVSNYSNSFKKMEEEKIEKKEEESKENNRKDNEDDKKDSEDNKKDGEDNEKGGEDSKKNGTSNEMNEESSKKRKEEQEEKIERKENENAQTIPQVLTANECVDKSFRFLCRGNEVIYCMEILTKEIALYNTYIISGSASEVSVYVAGFERKFSTKYPLSEKLEYTIADITLKNGIITSVKIKPDVINGKVLMTDKKQIEIEGYGKLPFDENYKIYKVYGELTMEQTNSILVGYTTTDFIVADGKICAALIKEKILTSNIRVLLKSSGYTSNYHDTVTLTANRDFSVTSEKGTENYKKGKELKVTASQIKEAGGRMKVIMDSENGKITISSIKRASGIPAYRGSIELVNTEEGILIINELPLEEYLYAVLPSEMPTSYSMEALKAQAVCARSYAYNQLIANRYSAYGAHVDDSVNCQVYNNIAEDETSILAVKDTYGKVAQYKDEVITTYYFSTSSGHTTNLEDVWEDGISVPYLTGCIQTKEEQTPDLTQETAFRNFLESETIAVDDSAKEVKETISTYDSDVSWYRWNVTISQEDITLQCKEQLEKRYLAGKSQILTQATEKEAVNLLEDSKNVTQYRIKGDIYISKKPEDIGTVKNLTILERGAGGIATSLLIEGTKSNILVRYQTNIRTLLAPVHDIVYRKGGGESKGMQLLPSAFITIDKKEEKGETVFEIRGGGYGHGLGMSQNGAHTMAKEGNNYEQILKHFYPGVTLGLLYEK